MTAAKGPSSRLAFPAALAEKIQNSGAKFVVTGGSGWIGQATLEMLESALGEAMAARVSVFGSSDRELLLRSGRTIPCRALEHITTLDKRPTYFIHCAFLTKDRLQDQSVENFVAANRKISDLVGEAMARIDTLGLFTPSSGAVYKKGTHELDDDLQKNAYGVMKIADEKKFSAFAREHKIPLCMPRLFNLSGPFINKIEIYALASMIKAAESGGPIIIRAPHRVVRSYIHVADLVALAVSMLLEPLSGDQPVFDTAGDDNLELGDLAEQVRKVLKIKCAIERPELVAGRDDFYAGDAQIMRYMMRVHGINLTPLSQQIADTANFLRSVA